MSNIIWRVIFISIEENRSLVLRFVEELWHAKNYDVIDQLLTPDFIAHNLPAGLPANREGYKKVAAFIHKAFPDIHYTIEDIIADKDKVVLRWDSRGTHKGEFMGIPATNKKVSRSGITIYRIAEGRIAEWWNASDLLTIMRQIGVFSLNR